MDTGASSHLNSHTNNNWTVEFDAFGFSVKDFLTRHILLRCDSSGDLYPVTSPFPTPHALLSVSSSTWHQRLGHPGEEVLRSLVSRLFISCNKDKSPHVCHAYQLGKHVRFPFSSSNSIISRSFEIVHSDIWTSPIVTLSRFSAEAEYRGVAETAWICNLLRELYNPLFTSTLVYCDNVSAVYMSTNPVQHQRTKHIEIDIHFVRDMVARGQVRVLHVPSRYQYADIFTKGFPTVLFEEFHISLSVRSSLAQTAGEC
ncbi:ribonuclease H-like domain-containing protein [Tanacetum coccineum]